MTRPNVVFITTDHQRADTLFMRQCGVEVTPHLNQLAAESCVFSKAYCSSPLCVPTRTALATGKSPARNGVLVNDWSGTAAGEHKPIHEYISDAGYRLGHFGEQHIRVRPELRSRVPFDAYMDKVDYKRFADTNELPMSNPPESKREVMELRNGTYEPVHYSSPLPTVWNGSLEQFQDLYFTRHAEAFLRESTLDHSRPFALFLNIWAPHPPLVVPEPYASRFPPESVELPANVGVPASGEPWNRRKGVPAQLAEGITLEEWRRTWSAHLALTQLADDCVGRVIQALKDTGAYENTLFLFMSDHGDHLGQHGMYQKMEMYEQAIRVPMIIKAPYRGPSVWEDVVSHLDVLPTMLDVLGIKAQDELDGVSLAPVLNGVLPPSVGEPRVVFSQYSGNPGIGDIRRAVVSKRYKYIYDPHSEEELYDLSADPLETNNQSNDPSLAETKEWLRSELFRWADRCGDTLVLSGE